MKPMYSVKQLLKKSKCKELGKEHGMLCRMAGHSNEISSRPASLDVLKSLRGVYRAAFQESFKYWWRIMDQRMGGV